MKDKAKGNKAAASRIRTLYRQYKRGETSRDTFMSELVGAHMRHEISDAAYRRYDDDVTADLYIDEDYI